MQSLLKSCNTSRGWLRHYARHLLSTSKDSSETLAKSVSAVNYHIRTDQADPKSHSPADLSRFFKLSSDTVNSLWLHKLLRTGFMARSKAIHDTALMVRAPALEGRDLLLELSSKESLAPKIVYYGVEGSGKSCIFAHKT